MSIIKTVEVSLSQQEIDSPEDIKIILHVHNENDPKNKEGVTYTITYPKKNKDG